MVSTDFQKDIIKISTSYNPLSDESIARKMIVYGATQEVLEAVMNLSDEEYIRLEQENDKIIKKSYEDIISFCEASKKDPQTEDLEIDYVGGLAYSYGLSKEEISNIILKK